MPEAEDRTVARWRLILGRFAEENLGNAGNSGRYGAMERVLDHLYGREYEGRGVRGRRGDESTGGGDGASVLEIPEWLREVRSLFPAETAEVIQGHALERYGMTELVTDPEILEKLEPSYDLLKAVLSFKGMMEGPVLETARRIVRTVVEEIRERLAKEVRQVLWGRLDKRKRSRLKVFRNLDFKRTIHANLKHWDGENQRLVLDALHFFSRVDRHLPWHVVMAVDCSGSMMDSVIHSAVMAGIFNGLPSVRTSLVAFDTEVVDLSDVADDPTEVLMSVQLGGGTNIAGALAYCETLVVDPRRTIVVLVTDFEEGTSPRGVVASVHRLREAGARVLGLAALDEEAKPSYDHHLAQACVEAGAEVAALTPRRLAEWLGRILG